MPEASALFRPAVLFFTLSLLAAPAVQAAKPSKQAQKSSKRDEARKAKAALVAQARKEAEKVGLPTCFVDVILACESGGQPGLIGHDENVPGRKAGNAFRACGKKYSGATFTGAAKNDDAHDLRSLDMSKPDYGIDWRYSHGFGLSQVTSENGACDKPNEKQFCMKDGKRGLRVPNIRGGTCMSIPELLTVEGGMKALVLKLTDYYKRQAKGTMNIANTAVPRKKVYGVMYAYGRGHQPKKENDWKVDWVCLRSNIFQTCAEKGTLADDLDGMNKLCHSWKKKPKPDIACDL